MAEAIAEIMALIDTGFLTQAERILARWEDAR
jgi:hypothetical protein